MGLEKREPNKKEVEVQLEKMTVSPWFNLLAEAVSATRTKITKGKRVIINVLRTQNYS